MWTHGKPPSYRRMSEPLIDLQDIRLTLGQGDVRTDILKGVSLRLDPGDFVYADPPYDVGFTQYARDGFSWVDQERTAELLARHPGPVVLVNQATPVSMAE